MLYLIEILHQTTTSPPQKGISISCILSKFYIKPQQSSYCLVSFEVVSYRNSTSNHNNSSSQMVMIRLYLIEILHQTTTSVITGSLTFWLYLIEILHQTTTANHSSFATLSLYLIEILHQTTTGIVCLMDALKVVSYRNSTSNHNKSMPRNFRGLVVSYRNSTSNHNGVLCHLICIPVVSYRNSTSNHNSLAHRAKDTGVVSYRNSTSNHNN